MRKILALLTLSAVVLWVVTAPNRLEDHWYKGGR